jgi:hypothetical protein
MADDEQRITDIVNRIGTLTLEANTLTNELRNLRERNYGTARTVQTETTVPNVPTFEHGFEIGDRVAITNRYQGKQGTEGIVTSITRTRITLQDVTGRKHIRKHTNVRNISTNRGQ